MSFQDTINAIWDDEFSVDELRKISNAAREAIKDVNKREAKKMASLLSPGDKVRIKRDANLRPKYILGTEAEVVGIKQRNADIRLGQVSGGGGRFRTGQVIGCPMDALERL